MICLFRLEFCLFANDSGARLRCLLNSFTSCSSAGRPGSWSSVLPVESCRRMDQAAASQHQQRKPRLRNRFEKVRLILVQNILLDTLFISGCEQFQDWSRTGNFEMQVGSPVEKLEKKLDTLTKTLGNTVRGQGFTVTATVCLSKTSFFHFTGNRWK